MHSEFLGVVYRKLFAFDERIAGGICEIIFPFALNECINSFSLVSSKNMKGETRSAMVFIGIQPEILYFCEPYHDFNFNGKSAKLSKIFRLSHFDFNFKAFDEIYTYLSIRC